MSERIELKQRVGHDSVDVIPLIILLTDYHLATSGKYLGSIDGHAHDAWPAAGHGGKILVKGGPIPIGHGGGWQ